MINNLFKKSVIVAVITVFIDFLFHLFLTNPMESLTYFVIKFLLAFFVATSMFSLSIYIKKKNKTVIILITGLVFSTLMSTYYRAWELWESYVPFGSRAPNILGISRESIFFSLVWWLGHAFFFIIGAILANKLIKQSLSKN